MTTDGHEPYEQGQRAYHNGQDDATNPYPFDSDDYLDWEEGWYDASEEAES